MEGFLEDNAALFERWGWDYSGKGQEFVTFKPEDVNRIVAVVAIVGGRLLGGTKDVGWPAVDELLEFGGEEED